MQKKISMWLLGILFAICVLALLIVQTALTAPEVRQTFAEQLDGLPVRSVSSGGTYLGEITLELAGIEPNNRIKVLQNGTSVASFSQNPLTITVDDNALIEIDGTKEEKDFQVRIAAVNSTCRVDKNVREITVQKNIAVLARIFVDG